VAWPLRLLGGDQGTSRQRQAFSGRAANFSSVYSADHRRGLLTFALFQAGVQAAIPGVWLLLYGTAIVTGGAFRACLFR